MKKRKTFKRFLCAVLLLMSAISYAQDPLPDPFPPPPQPGLPIDGGLLILFVVGVLFGAYMMYRFYNTKTIKKPL